MEELTNVATIREVVTASLEADPPRDDGSDLEEDTDSIVSGSDEELQALLLQAASARDQVPDDMKAAFSASLALVRTVAEEHQVNLSADFDWASVFENAVKRTDNLASAIVVLKDQLLRRAMSAFAQDDMVSRILDLEAITRVPTDAKHLGGCKTLWQPVDHLLVENLSMQKKLTKQGNKLMVFDEELERVNRAFTKQKKKVKILARNGGKDPYEGDDDTRDFGAWKMYLESKVSQVEKSVMDFMKQQED